MVNKLYTEYQNIALLARYPALIAKTSPMNINQVVQFIFNDSKDTQEKQAQIILSTPYWPLCIIQFGVAFGN